MYNIEISDRINQIIQIFHQSGLWRNEDGLTAFRKVIWKWLYLIYHLCFVVSVMSGGFSSDDKNEKIFLIAVGITNSVISVKLFYILWKKGEICAFISYFGIHSVEDKEEFLKIKKVEKLMVFSLCFMFILIGFAAALNIFYLPIFTSERRLPVNIWFPLDWENNAFSYCIAYVFVAIGIMISAITILFNVMIWYLMTNCAIKYQILGNQLRKIDPTKSLTKKRKISEEEKQKLFLEELIGLIKTHQNIQETIDRFKSCFANLFFSQITTSGICICGSVYVLAFGNLQESLFETALNLIALTYNIFDIFMVMYFGNEIKLSSDRLSYCLFESNWIEQSKSCKKCIIIFTEVLKQPQELVIGKLYPLTLETFTSILNLAYSMFNILKNLN